MILLKETTPHITSGEGVGRGGVIESVCLGLLLKRKKKKQEVILFVIFNPFHAFPDPLFSQVFLPCLFLIFLQLKYIHPR
jgi:hypothetical protein